MFAIVNGKIVLENRIESGKVLLLSDKIEGIVDESEIPEGCEIIDAEGKTWDALGLLPFTSVQSQKRTVGDVYGRSDVCKEAVVGFMNKSSLLTGVETPLLTALDLGFGNEAKGGAEGIHYKNVFGSHLTGPLLVKNPRLLDAVIFAIYEKRGLSRPIIPADKWAEEGYAVTARELKVLCGK